MPFGLASLIGISTHGNHANEDHATGDDATVSNATGGNAIGDDAIGNHAMGGHAIGIRAIGGLATGISTAPPVAAPAISLVHGGNGRGVRRIALAAFSTPPVTTRPCNAGNRRTLARMQPRA